MSLAALLAAPLMAISQSADLPAAYDNAVAARMAGEFAEAEAEFEAIVAAHPDHADAWLQLGLSRSAQGDFDGADFGFHDLANRVKGITGELIGCSFLVMEGDENNLWWHYIAH